MSTFYGPVHSACSKIVLSDLSEGMVTAAKENIGECDTVEYRVLDIQKIPYENEIFDLVLANMMLYHVPDIEQALVEVRRVLKKGSRFYCATYGEHGITEYLSGLLSPYGVESSINRRFTLQNGYGILRRIFSSVEKKEYADSLVVTNIDDMVEYIYSLSSMTSLHRVPKQEIKELLLAHTTDGVLNVPKEYGMFISF